VPEDCPCFVWARDNGKRVTHFPEQWKGGAMKESKEKRFGTIAVEKGFVAPEQVLEAIKIQLIENMKKNKHRPLGTIMVELGLMTKSQIDEILKKHLHT